MTNEIKRRGDAVSVTTSEVELTQAFAYASNGMVEYVGKAAPGTAKGDLKWQIQKLIYTGTNVTDIQWAEGSTEFKFEWDERTSYVYS